MSNVKGIYIEETFASSNANDNHFASSNANDNHF